MAQSELCEKFDDTCYVQPKPVSFNNQSNFLSFRTQNSLYVDKSKFIRAVIDGEASQAYLEKRRSGKSLNLSMLSFFFNCRDQDGRTVHADHPHATLFKGGDIQPPGREKMSMQPLLIASDQQAWEVFGKYSVIELSFAEVSGTTKKSILAGIQKAISIMYEAHFYLYKKLLKIYVQKDINEDDCFHLGFQLYNEIKKSSDSLPDWAKFYRFLNQEKDVNESEIAESLFFLIQVLHRFEKKEICILIDEYDTPVNRLIEKLLKPKLTAEEQALIDEIVTLISKMLASVAKPTASPFIYRMVFTGIYNTIHKEAASGLNNVIPETSLMQARGVFYGFTEEEIQEQLLNKMFDQNVFPGTKSNQYVEVVTRLLSDMKLWYNGYHVRYGFDLTPIYNAFAVMCYLKEVSKAFITLNKSSPSTIRLSNLPKPKSSWAESGSNTMIASLFKQLTLTSFQQFELLLNQRVQVENPGGPIYRSFLTGRNDVSIENVVYRVLFASGFLALHSLGNGELYFLEIPNREMKKAYRELISNATIQRFENNELNARHLAGKLHKNFEDMDQLADVITTNFIPNIKKGADRNELFFQSTLGGFFLYEDGMNKDPEKRYEVEFDSFVSNGKKIDTWFKPPRHKKKVLLHEYKTLNRYFEKKVLAEKDTALWQIFDRNYISKPVEERKLPENQHWETLEIRALVFSKYHSNWLFFYEAIEMNFEAARLIKEFVDSLKRDKNEDYAGRDPSARNSLLKKNNVKSLYELLQKKIGSSSSLIRYRSPIFEEKEDSTNDDNDDEKAPFKPAVYLSGKKRLSYSTEGTDAQRGARRIKREQGAGTSSKEE